MRVAITQEDDSTLEGMVVDYNAEDNTHFVICNLGMPDEAGDALPLVEYPDACQVRGALLRTVVVVVVRGGWSSMPAQ
jgi:hypothetical protein